MSNSAIYSQYQFSPTTKFNNSHFNNMMQRNDSEHGQHPAELQSRTESVTSTILSCMTSSTNTATNINAINNNKLHKRLLQPYQPEITLNRLQLFATVKILLQLLSREKPHLRSVAQKILKDCHKQHKNDPERSITLAELIERRLRETVGEKCWRIARTIQQRQCSISLKSVDKQTNRSEFIVRGNDNNKITLIVPLANTVVRNRSE